MCSTPLTHHAQTVFIYSGNVRRAMEKSVTISLCVLPSSTGMVLTQLIASILSCTSGVKGFYRNPKSKVFAYDLSLIALSVRTGYLVDVIHVPGERVESVYRTLLNDLQTTSDHFKNVVHVYEPDSNQSFFINKPLLLTKLKDLFDGGNTNCYPVFIYLPENDDPHKLSAFPAPLIEVLRYLQEKLASNQDSISEVSFPLPRNLSMVTLIPLAAVLLDYPIAYVPASEGQTSFLSGTPLVVYRCRLSGQLREQEDDNQQYILLQFSCPASLADGSMSIERTISYLEHTFQPRIDQILSKHVLHIEYERVTLDRVAL